MPAKVAIVLFNLGGPDSPEAIRPFLLNLFTDPAILRVPFFVRPFLARIITRSRLKPATENYAILGGKSPLLELTREQAQALEAALPEMEAKCFIAMRYWHPFSDETARAVKAWNPDRVLLLPLYPQYSTTTTGSSIAAWRSAAVRAGLAAETTTLCCYPTDPQYASATAALIKTAYDDARSKLPPTTPLRVLFSAHGLPEIIVRNGDPYQWQIERTVAAVVAAMGGQGLTGARLRTITSWPGASGPSRANDTRTRFQRLAGDVSPAGDSPLDAAHDSGIAMLAQMGQGLDHAICYQSRATPQKWIDPSTEAEIDRAARDKVAILVVPIAFVSEHSETLVELDVEYRLLAEKLGVPAYFRVPTQNADPGFIAALANLARRALYHGSGLCSADQDSRCRLEHTGCPFSFTHAVTPPCSTSAAPVDPAHAALRRRQR